MYPPPRQPGLIIHAILILTLATVAIWSAWQAFQAEVGLTLTLFILIAGAAFFPLPFLGYRAYALLHANYTLDRDTLTLHWGLRVEQIPISDVEWVRPLPALTSPLPLPWLRLPGSVLGVRRHADLRPVEFLAAESRTLLLVATRKRIFAISPADPIAFVENFQRVMEMGSLAPVTAHSTYPVFIIAQAWNSPLARYFWLVGLFLNIGLLVWVSLLVPTLSRVPLGFLPSGAPQETVPAVRLILLPVVSIFFFITGWLAGLYFYRRPDQRVLAAVVWAGTALTGLLFLLAVFFLVTTPA